MRVLAHFLSPFFLSPSHRQTWTWYLATDTYTRRQSYIKERPLRLLHRSWIRHYRRIISIPLCVSWSRSRMAARLSLSFSDKSIGNDIWDEEDRLGEEEDENTKKKNQRRWIKRKKEIRLSFRTNQSIYASISCLYNFDGNDHGQGYTYYWLLWSRNELIDIRCELVYTDYNWGGAMLYSRLRIDNIIW